MANVSIKFNNKEFLLACEDGQEEHLEELLIQINKKFNNLKNDLGNLGENKLLLITAVKIMDEYYETKKKVDQKKDELNDLSNKFKELKSLIYDYRDVKESEIEKLNLDHENLKQEIHDNQKKYENLSTKQNQLEIEKTQIEEKYKTLLEEHENLSKKLEDLKNKEKLEERKQIEFSEKIDELNQETDTLLDEIDKWQM